MWVKCTWWIQTLALVHTLRAKEYCFCAQVLQETAQPPYLLSQVFHVCYTAGKFALPSFAQGMRERRSCLFFPDIVCPSFVPSPEKLSRVSILKRQQRRERDRKRKVIRIRVRKEFGGWKVCAQVKNLRGEEKWHDEMEREGREKNENGMKFSYFSLL